MLAPNGRIPRAAPGMRVTVVKPGGAGRFTTATRSLTTQSARARQKLDERCSVTAARPLSVPHDTRLSPDHPHYAAIIAAHDSAMERGDSGYLDPATGLFVMTAACHARRGTCCTNGCRHCPFLE